MPDVSIRHLHELSGRITWHIGLPAGARRHRDRRAPAWRV